MDAGGGKDGRGASQAEHDRAQEEHVLTACAHCGDWHMGTLAESSAWFRRVHVCDLLTTRHGSGNIRPLPPVSAAHVPTQRVRIEPRVKTPQAVA